MNRLFLTIMVIVVACSEMSAQLSFGEPQNINQKWQFYLGDNNQASEVNLNDLKWQTINLPHDWSVKGVLSPDNASCMGYLPGGIGWYRKTINITSEKQNKKHYLYFEGVYNRSKVYVNGQLVGERPNGYVSFAYDITPFVKFDSDNIIAVRVDHSQAADSRWYTGSGIYRDVWLVTADPVHIAQWGVYAYPEVKSGKSALLHVETEVQNESKSPADVTVVNELISSDNRVVAKSTQKIKISGDNKNTVKQALNIKSPELWSLKNPYLYTLQTKVYVGGKLTDQNTMNTGIRTFTFDPDKGFALNGEWMKMKGVCIHHDAGVLGAASYKEVWERRLLKLKEVGVNAIRTSHNPQATHLYELCDELGLLVMDEAFDEWKYPKRKWLKGWNKGTPGFEGSYDFFESWGEQDLADMIRRDRNHVSIFAWSIGNEVDYPNDPYSHPVLDGGGSTGFTQPIFGGFKKDAPDAVELGIIAEKLAAVVKKYDLSRPVTAGLAGVAMSNATAYPGALDIAGYNYTENRYAEDHAKYPERVIYGSENRHELKAWKAVQDNDYIFGQFLWTGIDYLGESGAWPSRGFYSGLLDFGGFIKPRGYYRQSLWSDNPMIYIGTYLTPGVNSNTNMKDVWSQQQAQGNKKNKKNQAPSMDAWPVWNYESGQSIRVVCYTNGASASLLLNGKIVGEQKPYDDELGIIYWDIPYAAGKLEAIAYDAGNKEISRTLIQSSESPYALVAHSENPQISKDYSIANVVVDIMDENNIPVILADNEITCTIQGPAVLLGLEGSNNEDMTDYSDNVHRAYNGRMLAYIQSTGKEGIIKIKFSSPLLKSTEVEVMVK
ncbi:MAG: DUF4982 domain-containing protein [Pigmentiphaga sp.]|nr:DUF4982 domain-containing protein [Pigmentiphaga sp.]